MVVNEEIYKNLLDKEKTEKKERKYLRLCLKNKVCPVCGSPLTPMQTSDCFQCTECDFTHII